MLRRKVGKIKNGNSVRLTTLSKKHLSCKCGRDVLVDSNATAVTCSTCVSQMVAPPTISKPIATSDKPKGWKFMAEFVDKDGNVYHKGEEQPDLKGTLEPTDVNKIRAAQKERSKDRKKLKAEKEAKREAKLVAEFEKKQKAKKKAEEEKQRQLEKMKEEKNAQPVDIKSSKSVKLKPSEVKKEKKVKKNIKNKKNKKTNNKFF